MGFILAVHLPQVAPVSSVCGDIHTSLLAPGPGPGTIDGLGILGPADPTAVAAPEYLRIFPLVDGIPTGLTIVLQIYARDDSRSYPHDIVVSPAMTLGF